MLCAHALPMVQYPQCSCPAQVHCDIRNENVLRVTEDRYVVSDMVRRRKSWLSQPSSGLS